jgi:hypothetical protein
MREGATDGVCLRYVRAARVRGQRREARLRAYDRLGRMDSKEGKRAKATV